MKSRILSFLYLLTLFGLVAMNVSVAVAANTDDATLTTQAKRTDTLATVRGSAVVSGKLSSEFSTFAGSTANSDALVAGLRNGTPITLSSTNAQGVTTSTTFTPPTGKMGYGNVFISLAVAKQDLANAGITQPTAQQLQTALMGGTITSGTGAGATTTKFAGVLQMRSQGMGWGQIANSLGFKLGPVISGIKATNAHVASRAPVSALPTTPVSTAGGGAATKSISGVVTASGGGTSANRGIVTGAGGHVGGTTAQGGNVNAGVPSGRGIVTGTGASAVGNSGSANGHR